jgi:PAS domain S-box-containing protein
MGFLFPEDGYDKIAIRSNQVILISMISVLYVDDEPDLLTIGKLFLERAGHFTVTTCPGAAEAVELIRNYSFDAVVSDYQMPEMNGITFLKTLKSGGNTSPFILFTGKGREEVVIEALNNGASFYLQKGGDPKSQFAELSNAILNAVAHQRAVSDLRRKNEELQAAYEEITATEEELRANFDELVRKGEELRESRIFLDSVIEQSPHPIWISDEKGTLTRINKACCDLLQISPDEVTGRYNIFRDTVVKEQGKMELVRTVFDEGKTVTFELDYDSSRLRSLDFSQKSHVNLHVTIFPIKDNNGRITSAVIEHIDLTELKKTEAALQETTILFSEFMHHSPVYIFIKEVTPDESRVLQVSDNFEKMVGIPAASMRGKSMTELFPAGFAAKITADDWEVVSGGKVLEIREELNGLQYHTIKFPIIRNNRTLLAGYTIDISRYVTDISCSTP